MNDQSSSPQTPLTPRADRSRDDVRLFEETILALRGRWPATATGLCMCANSLFGFSLGARRTHEWMFRARVEEAVRLLEALDGPDAVDRVRTLASVRRRPDPRAGRTGRPRHRHLRVA